MLEDIIPHRTTTHAPVNAVIEALDFKPPSPTPRRAGHRYYVGVGIQLNTAYTLLNGLRFGDIHCLAAVSSLSQRFDHQH